MFILPVGRGVCSFKSNDSIHEDYVPLGICPKYPLRDEYRRTLKNTSIINKNGDVVGKYSRNRFGHAYGVLLVNTDSNEAQKLISDIDKNINTIFSRKQIVENIKNNNLLDGYLIYFDQHKAILSDAKYTGLTFYSLKDAEEKVYISQRGHKIPSVTEVENILQDLS